MWNWTNLICPTLVAIGFVSCSSPSKSNNGTDAGADAGSDAAGISTVTAPEYRAADTFTLGMEPMTPAIGDFNGDGHWDIAVVNQFSADTQLFVGDGRGGFTVGGDSFGRAVAVAAADFDQDGKDDIAMSIDGEARVQVVLDPAGTAFELTLDVSALPDGLAVADFDGDGDDDLAVSVAGTLSEPAQTIAMFPWGEATFGPAMVTSIGLQPRALRASGNNLVALLGTTSAVVLQNDGAGGFAASAPFGVGEGVLDIAVLDLDSSGTADLVAADLSANVLNAAIDIPSGDASTLTELSTPFGLARMLANDDTVFDLAITSVDEARVAVLLSKPDGTYGMAELATIPGAVRTGGLAAADFDEDGRDDLAVVVRNRDDNGALHLFLSTPAE